MKFLVCVAFAATLAGCAAHITVDPDSPLSVRDALVERLGSDPDAPVLGMAAVQAPEGLWNVYVASIPPGKLIVHQVRQHSEIVYGLTPEVVWGQDFRSGEARRLPDDYRYFIRSHELLRLGDRLLVWTPVDWGAAGKARDRDCTRLELRDDFDRPVILCLDDDGMPLMITLYPPEIFGPEPMHIYPEEWREIDGRIFLAVYEALLGDDRYHWNFQGIGPLEIGGDELEPPPGLLGPSDGPSGEMDDPDTP